MKIRTAVLSACLLSLASVSQGAITWQSAQNITGDSNVSTNGTSLYAYNFTTAAGTTTVNGVGFTNSNTFSVTGAYTFDFLSPSTGRATASDSSFNGGQFSALSSSYQALLGQSIRSTGGSGAGAANDSAFNAYALTLSGLTAGSVYEVQVWISDSRNLDPALLGLGHLDRGAGGPLVDYNVGNAAGNLGQYVVGTFTATGTSEDFVFDAFAAPTANVALLNAFQVRAIPEPSAALLAAAGLFAGISRRRR
ncbi:hypothetical protein OVA24_20980 [Luteolibacter sp. SL250]|uniref:hypothetical protein n=1 Tax=Luteolibacter sp. SL250 TaxID=2995170 RepID=UPI00226E6BFF|nr:hypothetical protein [Luteolibacter sp. SL250]WAC19696.1 hypothetical protein OVA24_20980 [Luteolibacter sp. SL250]